MPQEARKPPLPMAAPMPSPDRPLRVSRPWRTAPVTQRCHRGYSLLELMIVLAILTAMAGLSWPALMRPWSKNLVQQAGQELARELNRTRGLAIERSCVFHLRYRPGGSEYQIARALDPAVPGSTRAGTSAPDPYASGAEQAAVLAPSPDSSSGVPPDDLARNPIRDASSPGSSNARDASEFRLPDGVRFRAAMSGDRRGGLRPLEALPAETLETPGSERSASGDAERAATGLEGDGLEALLEDGGAWSETVTFYPDGRATNAQWTLESGEGYELDVTLRGLTGMATVGPVRATATSADAAAMDSTDTPPDSSPEEAPATIDAPSAGGQGTSP